MIRMIVRWLNGRRLQKRISSAILMVALLVSISGILGGIMMVVMSNRYNYALTNYGFSQGDIGKMMITFADTRSNLRAVIGYQDNDIVQSCYEQYGIKKQACKEYAETVKKHWFLRMKKKYLHKFKLIWTNTGKSQIRRLNWEKQRI